MGKTARESAPVRERGCLVWTRLNWQTAFVKVLTFYLAIGICYQWTPVDVVCSRAPCRMHPRSWLQKSRVMHGFPLSGPLHHLVIRKPATALLSTRCVCSSDPASPAPVLLTACRRSYRGNNVQLVLGTCMGTDMQLHAPRVLSIHVGFRLSTRNSALTTRCGH